MRHIALVVLLLGMSCISSDAVSTLSVEIGSGVFLHNSENSKTVMGDGEFTSFIPIGVSYGKSDLIRIPVSLSYEYQKSLNRKAIEYWDYDNQSPRYGDVVLISHHLDVNYHKSASRFISYGFGPTFVISNRIVDLEDSLYDRLASYGLGANGFIELSVLRIPAVSPFNTEWIAANLRFKSRYTHSVFFDRGSRELDGYSQSFFSTIVTMGLELRFN